MRDRIRWVGQRRFLTLHGVEGALVLMPIVILGYVYSLSRAAVVAPDAIQLAPTEDEELVEVGS